MSSFARTDRSLLARWWWTVDRWSLVALIALMGFGALLMLAASPAVGGRIGLDAFYLAHRPLVLYRRRLRMVRKNGFSGAGLHN